MNNLKNSKISMRSRKAGAKVKLILDYTKNEKRKFQKKGKGEGKLLVFQQIKEEYFNNDFIKFIQNYECTLKII